MKKGYKIGLFFTLIIIVVLVVLLTCKRYIWREQLPDGFKGNNTQKTEESTDLTQKDVISAQENDIRTTCDTVCIYEDIDKKDGTVVLMEEKLPGKYIDMTRSELEKALYDDSRQLSLEDKKRGFQSQHLELFSNDKVKIVRIYDSTEEPTGYYIMSVKDEIWIYKEDKETLYFKTDLKLDDLPEKLREEVVNGKYMDSEVKIYNFLESYSS